MRTPSSPETSSKTGPLLAITHLRDLNSETCPLASKELILRNSQSSCWRSSHLGMSGQQRIKRIAPAEISLISLLPIPLAITAGIYKAWFIWMQTALHAGRLSSQNSQVGSLFERSLYFTMQASITGFIIIPFLTPVMVNWFRPQN